MNSSPPKYALRFLRWFCRRECIEEVEGDLIEIFERNANPESKKARLKFVLNTLRYFRPEFIRPFFRNKNMNVLTMIRHNFISSFRNFIRHKSSFFINLTGLSTGLACMLLIFFWVRDEQSMDKFHEKDATLYQVLSTHPNGEGLDTWWEVQMPLMPALTAEMPEIDLASSSSGVNSEFGLSAGDRHFRAAGQLADSNYFRLFSYPFVEGNAANALRDKSAAVISESMAAKLFGASSVAIGKQVDWEFQGMKRSLQVTGVFKDVPANSTDQFDFVISYEVFRDIIGESANWGNFHSKLYLSLVAGTDVAAFAEKIRNYTKTKDKNSDVTFLLQKYSDRYLHGKYTDGVQSGGRIEYVRLFSIVALFIMGIACINFMNLSTARATRRIREVGIKKAIGAQRRSLIFQHLSESLLMTFISMLVAIGLVLLLLPAFNLISGKQLHFHLDLQIAMVLFGILMVTGLLAGSYPAFYLTGFSPAAVLKGRIQTGFGEAGVRKALVAFQFVLSVVLVVCVIVVRNQINLIQTTHLGYSRDNVIYFEGEGKVGEQIQPFLAELRRIPGVTSASAMWGGMVNNTGDTQGSFNWEGINPERQYAFSHLGIDYDLIELLGIEMKEGRAFSREFPGDTARIIINEAGIAAMGLKDPVGKIFTLWGTPMEIIGVTRNFNFRSMHEPVTPFFFRLQPKAVHKLLVRLDNTDRQETTAKIRALYKTFNPGYVFDYQFLDEDYQQQYEAEMRVSILSKYFAGFAILISCLGLLGLAAFTAEKRMREISIRKILGSGNWQIVKLLSGDFAKIIIASIAVAIPLSYWLSNEWLSSFAFKTNLSWWIFALAGVSTLIVGLLTVVVVTLRSLRMNVVENLKAD